MPNTGDRPAALDHTRCVHFRHELSPETGTPVPGRYCENEAGVFREFDCPVFQGRACRFFAARPAGEAPVAATAEELRELRARLSEDYLRWPYFRRVESLAPAEPELTPADGPPRTDTLVPAPGPARQRTPAHRRRHPPR